MGSGQVDDEQELRGRARDRRGVAAAVAVVLMLTLATGVAWIRGAFERDSEGRLAGEGPTATPEPGRVTTDTPVSGDTYVLLDNRTLQVQVAVGGGCDETGKAEGVVGEGTDTVQIRVTVTRHARTPRPDEVCPANLILQNVDLHLSDNLGGRAVVDEVGHKTLRRAPGDGDGVKAPAATKLRRTDEFGYVTSASPDGSGLTISVDRVDMLSGEEAAAASRAAGGDGDVPNDYFLRNDNPLVRTYRVDPNAVVWGSIRMRLPEPWPKQTTLARWREFVTSPAAVDTPFHFQIDDGVITGIEEQYLP